MESSQAFDQLIVALLNRIRHTDTVGGLSVDQLHKLLVEGFVGCQVRLVTHFCAPLLSHINQVFCVEGTFSLVLNYFSFDLVN